MVELFIINLLWTYKNCVFVFDKMYERKSNSLCVQINIRVDFYKHNIQHISYINTDDPNSIID